ncbi:MAG: zf-HC2 domain-containing protein [Gemmatimonadaceae bacterium]|nr:zf-HC2 domain-containing protein [Gemmatimonadaceae bacterium]
MSDCLNVEVRERLPELLLGALPSGERAVVEAHLATCAECAAELEVLRGAQAVYRGRRVPRIDTAAIVAALPRRPAAARPPARRSFATQWRIAAVVTFVALGGLSLTTVRRYFGHVPTVDTLAVAPAVATTGPAVDSPSAVRPVGLSAGGGLTDLQDDDIETLIGALDRIEAAPHVEPDTSAFLRIVSGATGGN